MPQYNIDVTLKFPDAKSGLLRELQHENKVLLEQWDAMLAELNPTPQFLLSLDDAKTRNAAAKTAAAPRPRLLNSVDVALGRRATFDLADQLPQGALRSALSSVDNFLHLDNRANGPVSKNPGEIIALIKTMLELDAKGHKVDWSNKSKGMFLGNEYNAVKSKRFFALMTTNLANSGRIPRTNMNTYGSAKKSAWFKRALDKYRKENI
jgi:hypothetical protein